jgi:tetratricopeptide (TPR) repeat protein
LAIREKKLGDESPGAADMLAELGVLESRQKQKESLAHLQRALKIREKTLPADSPLIGITLSKLGEAYLNLSQPVEARLNLERASKLLESPKGAPHKLAEAHFLLARALWDSHSDRGRAIELAEEARQAFIGVGKTQGDSFRELEAWLSAHRKPPNGPAARAATREQL